MKVLFDTSVLVASFVQQHPQHASAVAWLKRATSGEIDFFVSSHTLLELYSVLTRAPFVPRIGPEQAARMIAHNVANRATVVALTAADTIDLITQLATTGVTGGTTYDAIIVKCAEKAAVDSLLTLNPRDFLKLLPDNSIQIIDPAN